LQPLLVRTPAHGQVSNHVVLIPIDLKCRAPRTNLPQPPVHAQAQVPVVAWPLSPSHSPIIAAPGPNTRRMVHGLGAPAAMTSPFPSSFSTPLSATGRTSNQRRPHHPYPQTSRPTVASNTFANAPVVPTQYRIYICPHPVCCFTGVLLHGLTILLSATRGSH
jgi:hypothetical protein